MTFDSSILKPKGLESIFCSYPVIKTEAVFHLFIYLTSVRKILCRKLQLYNSYKAMWRIP